MRLEDMVTKSAEKEGSLAGKEDCVSIFYSLCLLIHLL